MSSTIAVLTLLLPQVVSSATWKSADPGPIGVTYSPVIACTIELVQAKQLLVSVPYTWVLALSAVLFAIGAVGVLLRRNGIAIFLSLEIMLNSANLAFAAFAYRFAAGHATAAAALDGQIFVFFIIAVAAAEAAVGLALFIALHRLKDSIDVDRANILRW